MKKIFTLLLIFLSISITAQRITYNIFDDLQYESLKGNYTATFKKDIFDHLIFTDSNQNTVTFEKKYLDEKIPEIEGKTPMKVDFFRRLIDEYQFQKRQKLTFSIDIFDRIVIEDQQGTVVEIDKDYLGGWLYSPHIKDISRFITHRSSGEWEFKIEKAHANLEEGSFGKWVYKDSSGNHLEFSRKTWLSLTQKHGHTQNVFSFLIYEFLL